MPSETQILEQRAGLLQSQIGAERVKYLRDARWNYFAAQATFWLSLLTSAAAAFLGLAPWGVEKWIVGTLAAFSTALLAAGRQLGFQQKANWHYRKVDRLVALLRRLSFELPPSPSADNLAAISRAWSEIDMEMSKGWEDMKHEAAMTIRK